MQNIEGLHCSECGNTEEYDLEDSYSECCNEGVARYTSEFLGEVKPLLFYPNGTNAPGVPQTCENQGNCHHE